MYITLLIVVALIIGYYARPKDKQSYHMAIMAILGIAYFCIWRFAEYYIQLFYPNTGLKNIVFASLMLVAVIIGLLPWVTAIRRPYAVVLAGLFGVCVIPTFALEKGIKNTLATWGGYFDNPAVVFKDTSSTQNTQHYHHEAGGFSISIPEKWQKNVHESGLDYFQLSQNGSVLAELRPRCFHNVDISITDIMRNILQWDEAQGFSVENRCFISTDNWHTCFVQSQSSSKAGINEKWRWLVLDEYQKQNIELDVIFYTSNAETQRDARKIIASLKVEPLKASLPYCASPTEWF